MKKNLRIMGTFSKVTGDCPLYQKGGQSPLLPFSTGWHLGERPRMIDIAEMIKVSAFFMNNSG